MDTTKGIDRPAGERSWAPNPQPTPAPAIEGTGDIEEHLVSLLAPSSVEAEQYRTLRHTVEQMHKNADLRTLAMTSPTLGDGKTTTAINLAGALAQAPELRVLLLEADLRQPSLVDRLGLGHAGTPGLVDAILNQGLCLEDVVQLRPSFNLAVLPAGRHTVNSYEMLKSSRLEELIQAARQYYDYVVLDMPPLIPFPDCRILEGCIDGFLVVVAAHKTPRKLVEEALQTVDRSKIVGLIFNGDDHPVSGYYYYTNGQSLNRKRMGRLSQVRMKLSRLLSARHGRQRHSPR